MLVCLFILIKKTILLFSIRPNHFLSFLGAEKFNAYLLKKIKFPKNSVTTSQGKIIIHVVIEKNGSADQTKVEGANSKELQSEIYRLIVNAPKWKPAMQNNKPVSFNYTSPIACILFSEE